MGVIGSAVFIIVSDISFCFESFQMFSGTQSIRIMNESRGFFMGH